MGRTGRARTMILIGCLLLAACRPAEPDAFAVTFHNDLGQTVWLALCKSDHSATCEHPLYRDRIADGGAHPENIAPDVGTEWAVQDSDSRLIGCVRLYWRHYPGQRQQLWLSHAAPWGNSCPDTTAAATPGS